MEIGKPITVSINDPNLCQEECDKNENCVAWVMDFANCKVPGHPHLDKPLCHLYSTYARFNHNYCAAMGMQEIQPKQVTDELIDCFDFLLKLQTSPEHYTPYMEMSIEQPAKL